MKNKRRKFAQGNRRDLLGYRKRLCELVCQNRQFDQEKRKPQNNLEYLILVNLIVRK